MIWIAVIIAIILLLMFAYAWYCTIPMKALYKMLGKQIAELEKMQKEGKKE